MVLSDQAKVIWKVLHGLMDTTTRTKTKTNKNHYHYKKKSVIFSVQYIIANHVISHPVISTILDVEKQQHNNQILHIHLLLKTIRKRLFTAILYHLAFTHS